MFHNNEECYRSLLLDDEEDYEEYIAQLSEIIKLNASDYISLNNRGKAYFETGKSSDALQDLVEACRLAPMESVPFRNRVDVLRATGDLQQALQLATNAIQMNLENNAGYYARAEVYRDMGDSRRAQEDIESAKNSI